GPPIGEVSARHAISRSIHEFPRRGLDAALLALEPLGQSGSSQIRALHHAWALSYHCHQTRSADPSLLDALQRERPEVLTHTLLTAMTVLVRHSVQTGCKGLLPQTLYSTITEWQVHPGTRVSPGS